MDSRQALKRRRETTCDREEQSANMKQQRVRRTGWATITVLLSALASLSAVAAPQSSAASPFLRLPQRAEMLVTVKFVLNVKMAGAGADREVESETTCLMTRNSWRAIPSAIWPGCRSRAISKARRSRRWT